MSEPAPPEGARPGLSMGRQFAAQVAESLLTRAFAMLVTLGIAVVVARALGPEGRGLYVVVTTIGMLGVQFANLGLFSSSVYYLARDPDQLPVLLGNSLVASLVLGALAAGVALTVNGLTSLRWLPSVSLAALALIWIPIGLLQLLLQNLLLGLQDVRGYNLCDAATRAATALFTGLVLIAGLANVDLLAGAAITGMLAGALIAFRRAFRRMQGRPRFSWPVLASHLPYGARAYFVTLFGYIVTRADVLIVQHFLGAGPTGTYSVALTLAEAAYMVPVVIGAMLFPRLSAPSGAAQKWQLTRQVLLPSAAVLGGGLTLLFFLAEPLVVLLFGAAFQPAVAPLQILLPGVFFLGVETILVQYLNARGFPPALVAIWLAVAIIKCAALIVTVPEQGPAAAAVVTSAVSLLLLVLVGGLVLADVRRARSDEGWSH